MHAYAVCRAYYAHTQMHTNARILHSVHSYMDLHANDSAGTIVSIIHLRASHQTRGSLARHSSVVLCQAFGLSWTEMHSMGAGRLIIKGSCPNNFAAGRKSCIIEMRCSGGTSARCSLHRRRRPRVTQLQQLCKRCLARALSSARAR